MTDPILADAKNIDQRNYLYAKRKEQIARYALDGDWAAIRRVLDYIDRPTADHRLIVQAIADPGRFTPRGDDYSEPIVEWGARAVAIALGLDK